MKTLMGNTLFDQIFECRIVFIYMMLIVIIKCCESFQNIMVNEIPVIEQIRAQRTN